jgi:hypothetical protein
VFGQYSDEFQMVGYTESEVHVLQLVSGASTRKHILILSFCTSSSCTQPIEQMFIAQDGQGKIQGKDEPASENHNLNRTLRKKFCKGSGAMWHTYLINIHITETTEQQHIIHKQEDCQNPRRVVSQKIVTTCSHFPCSLREGVLKKHMSGGRNAVKAL